ncbi:glutamate--tRNA ligase [Desulfurococcaceae archaeon MEX13E-LK6-19]|nr:glutamate--tRNA ligase [Desulfurococcaceae archaeon MEX13E-LK6-19]
MTLEESLLKEVREIAYKHALLNAYKHGGKAALGPVVSKIVAEKPEVRKIIKQLIPVIKEVVEEVNKLTLEEQERILRENWPELLEEKTVEEKKELPPLPNAVEGKVVTRFAPNPDYTIHLGNARPALLSYLYAVMYKGKMILRFEDTDPRTKAPFPDAYNQIKDDLKWLGIKWDEEYIQSMRMPIFYDIAKELIKRGGAYVDKCSPEEFRRYRDQRKPCPHRDKSPEEQLEEFDKMLEGHYGEGEAVVRVKTDLNHPDPSVRDWVALRIIDTSKTPHPVVGDKYIVWPTYNFAAAIDDHLMGVTHILRAKEHQTNTIKQKYLYDYMGWKYPETIHFGRLSLEGVMLSKSKMRAKIKEGFMVYDDPRFGTLAALRRRGIVPETIHEIIKDVGIKSIDAVISYANLASINRKIIDPRAPRYMMVVEPLELVVENAPETLEANVLRHPDTRESYKYVLNGPSIKVYVSSRDIELFTKNKIVRLMELANVEYKGVIVEKNKVVVKTLFIDTSLDTARKHGAPIIQWVPEDQASLIEIWKPEGEELIREHGLVEKALEEINEGTVVQFYRYGFARIEKTPSGLRAIYAHN